MDIKTIIGRLAKVICMDGATDFFDNVNEYGTPALQLENEGFRINFANGNTVRLYMYCGTIFGNFTNKGWSHNSMAWDQKKAMTIWNEVTDVLLVA